MKLHGITAALLLATQAFQVQAVIGPHLGVSYVYAIVTSVVHDLIELIDQAKFGHGKTVCQYRTGLLISLVEAGNGQFQAIEEGVQNGNEHFSVKISASGIYKKSDPICMASFAFSPDSRSASADRAYGIPAELMLSMDDSLPWSYSGYDNYENTPSNSCRSVKIPGTCVWFSLKPHDDYDPVSSLEIRNIPDFHARVSEPAPRLPPTQDFIIHRVGNNRKKRDLSRSDPSSPRNNYAFSGYQSAKVLCESRGSVGPSFFSTEENLYCDMTTKTLYPPCSSTTGGESCFRVTNGTVSVVNDAFGIHKRSISEISALRLVSLNAEEDHSSLSRLAKRAAVAPCVPGNRITSLNAGQVMPMNTYLQDQGNYRMAVVASGDIIVWDANRDAVPSEIAIWKMGVSSDAGLFVVELKTNGQLCSRADQGPLIKCVGTKGAEGKPYKLTITADGYLYIKNGAQVVWTNNPRTTLPPKDVDGYPLTKTNSIQGLDSIEPGTLFKSNDGSTKMEYSKVGSLCIYNKLGYNTWCLDSPPGNNGKMWLTISSRGNLCTNRQNSGVLLESRCTGNQGGETNYFAVLHNDGFLKIYDSAEKVVWQRGGSHAFRDRNTLRAGAVRKQDGDLRSDNDRYSIYAHNQGGLVIRDNHNNNRIVWSLGGGVTSSGPFNMMFGVDANLCVANKDLRHLSCINNFSLPEDKYLLYMENDGRAYIYKPDGKSVWRSPSP
ncbi:hypothetical protein BGX23_005972 [Mortierella sp. AD031]|nr:hypothetical protein BGX23_005972 [Mortierella sp. AD031]